VDDRQLRQALKRKVLAAHVADPQTRVIDELGLEHGASRIDVAVVNGIIHGYELKSERDTLNRLPGQMPIYSSVLDRVTLIAAERHAEAAIRVVPPWWGIKVADVGQRGGIQFRTLQKARDNPALQPLAIARLLWREEAMKLLTHLGESRGLTGQRRATVYARLAEVAPLDLLRCHVRERLKKRTDWRFEQPRKSDGDSRPQLAK
jgi:hypothetical protein